MMHNYCTVPPVLPITLYTKFSQFSKILQLNGTLNEIQLDYAEGAGLREHVTSM